MLLIDTTTAAPARPTREEISMFLLRELAEILEVSEEEIETDIAFDRYGVDSASAVYLAGKLSTLTGKTLEPTLLYDFPTIAALSQHLATEIQ